MIRKTIIRKTPTAGSRPATRRTFLRGALAASAGVMATPALALSVEDFVRLKLHEPFPSMKSVNGRSNFELIDALRVPGDAQYHPCREAYPVAGVPTGKSKMLQDWQSWRHYPGTYRDILLYAPTGTASKPAKMPVMVFNDGLIYADPEGPLRATVVLDNLIHSGEIPAMAAIFVMPGGVTEKRRQISGADSDPADRAQRSIEYDSLSPRYGRFLVEEVLPLAERELGVSFSQNPDSRAICGISSGGICAFNAAWHHPDQFRKVVSHCGSFVNIRGGHNYPYLIRSTQRKPLRVYLTTGTADGNIIFGSWPLANRQMAAALDYAGYDYRFEMGEGGHSLFHGGALFAETVRWLWRS